MGLDVNLLKKKKSDYKDRLSAWIGVTLRVKPSTWGHGSDSRSLGIWAMIEFKLKYQDQYSWLDTPMLTELNRIGKDCWEVE